MLRKTPGVALRGSRPEEDVKPDSSRMAIPESRHRVSGHPSVFRTDGGTGRGASRNTPFEIGDDREQSHAWNTTTPRIARNGTM